MFVVVTLFFDSRVGFTITPLLKHNVVSSFCIKHIRFPKDFHTFSNSTPARISSIRKSLIILICFSHIFDIEQFCTHACFALDCKTRNVPHGVSNILEVDIQYFCFVFDHINSNSAAARQQLYRALFCSPGRFCLGSLGSPGLSGALLCSPGLS